MPLSLKIIEASHKTFNRSYILTSISPHLRNDLKVGLGEFSNVLKKKSFANIECRHRKTTNSLMMGERAVVLSVEFISSVILFPGKLNQKFQLGGVGRKFLACGTPSRGRQGKKNTWSSQLSNSVFFGIAKSIFNKNFMLLTRWANNCLTGGESERVCLCSWVLSMLWKSFRWAWMKAHGSLISDNALKAVWDM